MPKETKNIVTTAIIFAVLALGIGYFVYDLQTRKDELSGVNKRLNDEIKSLKAKADQRPIHDQTLQQLEDALEEYVKILPSPEIATEEEIIRVFSSHAERSRIKIGEIIRQADKKARGGRRGKKAVKKDFEEIVVRFRIEGQFEQFVRFLNLVERDETFLQVRSFSLTTVQESSRLNANLAVSTFRYNVRK